MEIVKSFFTQEFYGIVIWVYFAALGAVLAGFIGKKIIAVILDRLNILASKTKMEFDDIFINALTKPLQLGSVFGGIFIALIILPLPSEPLDINKFIHQMLSSTSLVLIIWFAIRFVDGMANWWEKKAESTESKLDDQLVPIVRKSTKVFLYIIGFVLILQNLGYSVQSLLAGLGIGGLAVAMAAKDTVANLFGSIVIFLDKPFQVGDWIEFSGGEGTVEEIGLRTTRIRTFANSLITVPNAAFTTDPVNNWSKMQKRRIKMSIGVTYGSSSKNIKKLLDDLRAVIAANDKIRNDFYLVNFDNFGPSSLDIFIYCFTVTTNWAEFLQVKEDFLFEIMNAVEKQGLSFAFPTQSLHIESLPGGGDVLSSQRPV
ncbi:MAG: mechanosensitive ion channel family protein [Deltaproteobacteria bacterium]|nr:mechanosensitive ion channel family protein [Deltaproteobacteria bacterium]